MEYTDASWEGGGACGAFAAEDPLQTPENAGGHVEHRNHKQRRTARRTRSNAPTTRHNDDQTERMAGAEINVLEAIKAPSADHQIADDDHHEQPAHAMYARRQAVAAEKVHDGGNHSSACRDGHADKIFLAGAAGIRGLRID